MTDKDYRMPNGYMKSTNHNNNQMYYHEWLELEAERAGLEGEATPVGRVRSDGIVSADVYPGLRKREDK